MVASKTLLPPECDPDDDVTFALGPKNRLPEPATPIDNAPPEPPDDPLIGRLVGNYFIEECIGEGGMGAVYRAEQLRPVKRTVALKMIRAAIAGDEVTRRFLAERQTLALMEHPEIARVLDAGELPGGRPYFVMEFADGVPLDEYCDARRLSVRQRVELLARVSRAIQHAHTKGVIHRDIKPGNIIVAEEQGEAVIKVIDFGIAKATDESNADGNRTRVGQIIGTPQYMSPEQATSSQIDGRCDVFALGAVLFQLLTGKPPLDVDGLDDSALLIRRIAEFDPIPLSRALAKRATEDLAALAERRGTGSKPFVASLKGDLDWIVLRALASDRTQRYATAGDLADDLQRYLDDQPIRAAAPSWRYRCGKFARRHRAGVFATAAVVITTLIGGVAAGGVWWRNSVEARRKRDAVAAEIAQHLAAAESARSHARQSRALWEPSIATAENRIGQAEALLERTPGLNALQDRAATIRRQLNDDERHATFARKLHAARDRGAGVSPLDGHRDRQLGRRALRKAFADYGVQFLKTAPAEAAATLAKLPAAFRQEAIDSLDFCLNEDRVGIGLETERHQNQLCAGTALPGFPAAKNGTIRRGDNLLSLVENGRTVSLASLSPAEAGRRFAGKPGTTIRLKLRSALRGEYQVALKRGGAEAYWAAGVLDRLDPHPWRTRLREAIIAADGETLRQLAKSKDLKRQSPFSLILLARKLPQPEHATVGIDILYLAQRSYPHNFWTNQYLGLGLLLDARRAKPYEAARYFTAATAIHPGSKNAHSALANVLLMTRRFEQAVASLYRVVEIDPQHRHLRYQLARVLHHLNRHDEAVTQYRELLKQRPKDAGVMAHLAEIYEKQGRVTDQIALYRDGVKAVPKNTSLRYQLAGALFDNGEREAAAKQYEIARRLPLDIDGFETIYAFRPPADGTSWSPARVRTMFREATSPAVQHKLHGYVLLQVTDLRAAKSALQQSLRLDADDPETHFFLGRTWELLRNAEKAIAAYREAIRLKPDYDAARTRVARLNPARKRQSPSIIGTP